VSPRGQGPKLGHYQPSGASDCVQDLVVELLDEVLTTDDFLQLVDGAYEKQGHEAFNRRENEEFRR